MAASISATKSSSALLEQLVDQLRLVGEAAVDGADADAGVVGDVVERDAEAALGEQLARGVEDPLTVALGVARSGAACRRPASVMPEARSKSGLTISAYLLGFSPETDIQYPLGFSTLKPPLDRATHDNPHHERRWAILAILGIAQLMVVLDATIVNIALPSAQKALHFSNDNRQWIVTAYSLAFGSLLLLGGKIADLFGRKWTFIGRPGRLRAAPPRSAARRRRFGMLVGAARLPGRVRRAAGPRRAVAADHHLHRALGARQGVRHLRRRSPVAAPRSACCSAGC